MADHITVTAPTSYQKFQVPNSARLHMPPRQRQDGVQELPAIPLTEVPVEAFHKLVEAWVSDIYRKAGKEHPPMAACNCRA